MNIKKETLALMRKHLNREFTLVMDRKHSCTYKFAYIKPPTEPSEKTVMVGVVITGGDVMYSRDCYLTQQEFFDVGFGVERQYAAFGSEFSGFFEALQRNVRSLVNFFGVENVLVLSFSVEPLE